ncbi:MAG: metallophosphoesterase [Acidobacteria bacterium]|nr:metallophosphoesterase [Acidobacteriota bacterium]
MTDLFMEEHMPEIGQGGMSVVYRARDFHPDRCVAIEVLPPESVSDLGQKRHFVQEAKSASALKCFLYVFFILLFCPLMDAAEVPCVWKDVEKIIVIGDIHGDYDNFLSLLKGLHLVGNDLHWTGEKTHFVQIGDILDRGPGAKYAMDLLMRLEKEAPDSGGMVHVIIGNHEELNVTGRVFDYPDYVTVEQFVSFLPESFRKSKERKYLADFADKNGARAASSGPDPVSDMGLRAYWQNLIRKDKEAQRAYVTSFNRNYGRWLAQKNSVIKINDIIFSHAGISEKYATWRLRDINEAVRSELRLFMQYLEDPSRLSGHLKFKILYDNQGPLWYRGLATRDEKETEKEIIRILDALNARVMVTGHNFFQNGKRMPLHGIQDIRYYGGRVYNTDTGINRVYHGLVAALTIEGGKFDLFAVGPEQRRAAEAPSPKEKIAAALRGDMEKYLKAAAVVEIDKSSVPGRTAPWRIALEEAGVSRQAIFKYIDHRRPDPLPDSFKYELAAYALARYLDLEFVPPIVERKIDDIAGSLQLFVENTISEEERKDRNIQPVDAKSFAQDMDDLRVFQSLAAYSCENVQDVLVDQNTWKIYAVDFSQAFAPKSGTLTECRISQCSQKLYRKLLTWDREKIKNLLAPYLNEEEILALNARRDSIIETIERQ